MSPKSLEVLHICSDFAKQRIYFELVRQLAADGITQKVYVPVRSAAELTRLNGASIAGAEFHCAKILRPVHRVLFRRKISTVTKDLLSRIEPRHVTNVHAHFLYSDGGVARALNRAYGLPYVVSVRNTDVNYFMKLRPDLRWLAQDILERARRVVFITPSYREIVSNWLPARRREAFFAKSRVIPNGLPQFWLTNTYRGQRAGDVLKILYVGDFSRNKNIPRAVEAVFRLGRTRPAPLTLVGGGGDGEQEVRSLLASASSRVSWRGRVDDPGELMSIYRQHDIFLMPSLKETFGVSYIEAMSQGLPVVFTRGQGIDGYFPPGGVAEGVDPLEPDSICAALLALAQRLDGIREQCVASAQAFNWPRVARMYADCYRDSLCHD
jgi:glycosyltransferase involved in cell wall biosynthesis